mmetsp:Transcript_20749/g.44572  ORF Transcript_20749/g.44572 Transcript_20749/m.44572 type:complete len:290 (-) Transcript_20749:323-1192(-)
MAGSYIWEPPLRDLMRRDRSLWSSTAEEMSEQYIERLPLLKTKRLRVAHIRSKRIGEPMRTTVRGPQQPLAETVPGSVRQTFRRKHTDVTIARPSPTEGAAAEAEQRQAKRRARASAQATMESVPRLPRVTFARSRSDITAPVALVESVHKPGRISFAHCPSDVAVAGLCVIDPRSLNPCSQDYRAHVLRPPDPHYHDYNGVFWRGQSDVASAEINPAVLPHIHNRRDPGRPANRHIGRANTVEQEHTEQAMTRLAKLCDASEGGSATFRRGCGEAVPRPHRRSRMMVS